MSELTLVGSIQTGVFETAPTIGQCNQCDEIYASNDARIGYICGATITIPPAKEGDKPRTEKCMGVVIRHSVTTPDNQ